MRRGSFFSNREIVEAEDEVQDEDISGTLRFFCFLISARHDVKSRRK